MDPEPSRGRWPQLVMLGTSTVAQTMADPATENGRWLIAVDAAISSVLVASLWNDLGHPPRRLNPVPDTRISWPITLFMFLCLAVLWGSLVVAVTREEMRKKWLLGAVISTASFGLKLLLLARLVGSDLSLKAQTTSSLAASRTSSPAAEARSKGEPKAATSTSNREPKTFAERLRQLVSTTATEDILKKFDAPRTPFEQELFPVIKTYVGDGTDPRKLALATNDALIAKLERKWNESKQDEQMATHLRTIYNWVTRRNYASAPLRDSLTEGALFDDEPFRKLRTWSASIRKELGLPATHLPGRTQQIRKQDFTRITETLQLDSVSDDVDVLIREVYKATKTPLPANMEAGDIQYIVRVAQGIDAHSDLSSPVFQELYDVFQRKSQKIAAAQRRAYYTPGSQGRVRAVNSIINFCCIPLYAAHRSQLVPVAANREHQKRLRDFITEWVLDHPRIGPFDSVRLEEAFNSLSEISVRRTILDGLELAKGNDDIIERALTTLEAENDNITRSRIAYFNKLSPQDVIARRRKNAARAVKIIECYPLVVSSTAAAANAYRNAMLPVVLNSSYPTIDGILDSFTDTIQKRERLMLSFELAEIKLIANDIAENASRIIANALEKITELLTNADNDSNIITAANALPLRSAAQKQVRDAEGKSVREGGLDVVQWAAEESRVIADVIKTNAERSLNALNGNLATLRRRNPATAIQDAEDEIDRWRQQVIFFIRLPANTDAAGAARALNRAPYSPQKSRLLILYSDLQRALAQARGMNRMSQEKENQMRELEAQVKAANKRRVAANFASTAASNANTQVRALTDLDFHQACVALFNAHQAFLQGIPVAIRNEGRNPQERRSSPMLVHAYRAARAAESLLNAAARWVKNTLDSADFERMRNVDDVMRDAAQMRLVATFAERFAEDADEFFGVHKPAEKSAGPTTAAPVTPQVTSTAQGPPPPGPPPPPGTPPPGTPPPGTPPPPPPPEPAQGPPPPPETAQGPPPPRPARAFQAADLKRQAAKLKRPS